MLRELSVQSAGRTAFENRTRKKCEGETRATFDSMLRFLVRNGYVQKTGPAKRAPYCITERGKKFLGELE